MVERRVVVTGIGVLACNGVDVPSFWEALQAGRHGIGPITHIDVTNHATKFGGQVPLDSAALAGGDRKMVRRKDRFVLLALRAAAEAMAMAGFAKGADGKPAWKDPFRVATVIGAGVGGLTTIEEEYKTLLERGPGRVSPMMVPKMIVDSAAGDVSIVYGAKGPNYAMVTACATGSHCIGAAFHHVRHGQCDVAICGGTEAPICHLGVSGFNSIGALSKRNDDPGHACRPFDKDRDGFIIAEGAGILVLEELGHALARGATILGEMVGYGCTGDAHHETAPDPTGAGGSGCMRMALADAGIAPEAIGYINAHGTSTEFNDKTETAVIKQVFGAHARKVAVSSTKSMTGHTLGAAGGVEAIASILALKHGILPPTINLQTPDPECDLDYVPNVARKSQVEYALSNNLGFGGHNASVIFKRYS